MPVDDEFPVELPFEAPGRYTVTCRTAACPPLGKVSSIIEVTAR